MKRQTIYKHDPSTRKLSVQCCFEPSTELKALLRYLHKDESIKEEQWKAIYANELDHLRQPVEVWGFPLQNCRQISIIEMTHQRNLDEPLKFGARNLLLPIFKRVKEKEYKERQRLNAWEKEKKAFKEEIASAKKERRAVSLPAPSKNPSSPKHHQLPNLTHFKQLYFTRFFSEGATILSGPSRYFDDLYLQAQSEFLYLNLTYLSHVKTPFSTVELEIMYFQAKRQKLSRTQRDKFDTLLRYFILHIDKNTYVCTKTQRQMAQETHIAESTVSRFIDTLVAAKKVIRYKVSKTSTKLLIAADDMFDGQKDVPRPISKNYSFIEACILQSKHLEKLYYQAICHSKLPNIRQLAITEYTMFKRS
ncbi:hypothetical protein AB4431_02295 [Vibrio artabrorum]|uniref:hypothetical protein n=1 Tax=Vibrio artabrorum TaxID=446374 RepID=UPI0035544C2D